MDFKFNVNRLLPRKINKITHSLIPEDFRGDRRELNEYQRQLSRILDEMGEASARAQGLSKPITSAMKLRDTDHIVYFLVDREGNGGLGSIVGLLKTGSKNLFMFNEIGLSFELHPRCVLDFYIHETRQRMGLGKILYEHMLAEERIMPVKLAIDRPSEKFLQFLHKYYGLEKIIPQNNKFVVFQGFFNDEFQDLRNSRYSTAPRSLLDGTVYNNNDIGKHQSTSIDGQTPQSAAPRSAYGRYAAARPPCSMANIIHNAPIFDQAVKRTRNQNLNDVRLKPETDGKGINSVKSEHVYSELPAIPAAQLERPRSLSLYTEDQQKSQSHETTPVPALTQSQSIQLSADKISPLHHSSLLPPSIPSPLESEPYPKPDPPLNEPDTVISVLSEEKTPSNANTSIVKASPSCAQEVSGNQSGHLDLKFYHSPLW